MRGGREAVLYSSNKTNEWSVTPALFITHKTATVSIQTEVGCKDWNDLFYEHRGIIEQIHATTKNKTANAWQEKRNSR